MGRGAKMKKLVLVAALLLTASSVAAQVSTLNGQQQLGRQQELGLGGQLAPFGQRQPGVQGRQSVPSQAPTTGVICIEEMTATFCNVPSGPNTNGYGSSGGSAATGGSAASGGVGRNASSIPFCASGTPANELCE